MRFATMSVWLLLFCSQVSATELNTVAVGTDLKDAGLIIQQHGLEMDGQKYGLAMVASDSRHALEFCPLDHRIMLIIEYKTADRRVTSLSLRIFCHKIALPKSERNDFSMPIESISFQGAESYTITMKRSLKEKNLRERCIKFRHAANAPLSEQGATDTSD